MDNLNDLLKGLNLEEGIEKVKKFALTDEGKKMINDLQSGKRKVAGVDKEKVMGTLQNNPELMKKLNDLLK